MLGLHEGYLCAFQRALDLHVAWLEPGNPMIRCNQRICRCRLFNGLLETSIMPIRIGRCAAMLQIRAHRSEANVELLDLCTQSAEISTGCSWSLVCINHAPFFGPHEPSAKAQRLVQYLCCLGQSGLDILCVCYLGSSLWSDYKKGARSKPSSKLPFLCLE